MSITTTHVANFKLRLQLLIIGVLLGAAVGGWIGHQIIHTDMPPQEAQDFHQYLAGRAKEIVGIDKLPGHGQRDRHLNFVHELRSSQHGYWAQKFEISARQAYIQFPLGGAFAIGLLVLIVGRRIGGVAKRNPT